MLNRKGEGAGEVLAKEETEMRIWPTLRFAFAFSSLFTINLENNVKIKTHSATEKLLVRSSPRAPPLPPFVSRHPRLVATVPSAPRPSPRDTRTERVAFYHVESSFGASGTPATCHHRWRVVRARTRQGGLDRAESR